MNLFISLIKKIYLKFPSLSLFSSRPGRPPKRSLGMSMQDGSRLLPHSVHGLLSPSLLSPTGTSCSLLFFISLTVLSLCCHLSDSALLSALRALALFQCLLLFCSSLLSYPDRILLSHFFYAHSLSFCPVLLPHFHHSLLLFHPAYVLIMQFYYSTLDQPSPCFAISPCQTNMHWSLILICNSVKSMRLMRR